MKHHPYANVLSRGEQALIDRMAEKIRDAERALGPLSFGQRSDLLMDNFTDTVADTDHAHYIVAAIEDGYPDLRRRT